MSDADFFSGVDVLSSMGMFDPPSPESRNASYTAAYQS
jgi:hypothetical protein